MQKKTAIITGGGSGFGREVALQLAKKGTNISVVDISEENGEETVRLCKELGCDTIFIQADVSKVEDVKKYVAQTVDTFGKIDLFFNNAGISGSGVRTIECSVEEFNTIVDVNLKGVFYGLKKEVESLTNRLRDEGYRILSEPRTTGDGYFESVISDPDGNRVEITI